MKPPDALDGDDARAAEQVAGRLDRGIADDPGGGPASGIGPAATAAYHMAGPHAGQATGLGVKPPIGRIVVLRRSTAGTCANARIVVRLRS